MKTVIKRSGKTEPLTKKKIFDSIVKANNAIEEDKRVTKVQIQRITDTVFEACQEMEEPIPIDAIEDMIEKKLMGAEAYEVAKKYITYRYEKERVRNNRFLTEKLTASNVVNQNANIDEFSFGGRIGESASYVMKEYALNNLISDKARQNHMNNEIYIHDLDHYAVGDHNCLSCPMDHLLKDGFTTRQCDIRGAKSINTAMQLVAVIFQLQSLNQFGGVSATHLDWTMVPYVRMSFKKHYMDGLKYISKDPGSATSLKVKVEALVPEDTSIEDGLYKQDERVYRYAMEKTTQELQQAVEGMYHNLNSLQSRSGCQVPFSSINYGTCTSPEGRMVIKALLEGSIKGVGKFHKTSIFPCGIFQCMEGVNRKPGDPNYDLFRLALRSTSTRLYPNYCNCNWSTQRAWVETDRTGRKKIVDGLSQQSREMLVKRLEENPSLKDKLLLDVVDGELKVYDKVLPIEMASTMGALDGKEHLYVKINDGQAIDVSIKELFDSLNTDASLVGRPSQIAFTKERLNLPGKSKYVQDHTFNTCGNIPGVYRITYIPQDVSYIGSSGNMGQRWNEHKVAIRCSGGPDCGMKFGDPCLENYKFEVIEETSDYKAAEKKYILKEANINVRGISEKYYKNIQRKWDPIYERPDFKQDRTIPQILINLEDKNIKVLDRNGVWVKVRHIFKNDKRNSPFMMHVRYQEFDKEHVITCTEDHPLWTGEDFTQTKDIQAGDLIYRADGQALPVLEVSWHWEPVDSYDIGTESGTFIGSDIIMHNCRTVNGADINAMDCVKENIESVIETGKLANDVTSAAQKDGRGNVIPVTIIMPTLAMEVKELVTDELNKDKERGLEWEEGAFEETCIEKFMKLLDKKIVEAKDMLLERFDWICSQPAKSAKFMYDNGAMVGFKKEEGVKSALKHGTLTIGQLGLAETLQLLLGCDQTTETGMELAKRIEHLFVDRCNQFKKEYKFNFGVYMTPAENLAFTAMTKFKDKYGVIPKVSDKKYFTNSIHVPVWHKLTPFEKIDIESQLTGYSSAGIITYVELDAGTLNNIDALDKLVNYAMDKDIPYFALNVPADVCLSCGFQGEIPNTCPQCGSGDIERLRRVTGYLSTDYHKFNLGKQDEVEHRVKHNGVCVDA